MRSGERDRVGVRRTHRYAGDGSRPRGRRRRGVSLLEAIAALAIVGATSAGVLATTGAGVRASARARQAHEAEALGLELFAQLSLASESTLRALPDSLAGGRFAPPFDEYTWRTAVGPHGEVAGLYDVRIDIMWGDGTQALSSALYRRPVRVENGEAP